MPLGVYIQDIYGNLYTEDEWDGSQTANGVVVSTENCSFVISLNRIVEDYKWSESQTIVPGITTTTDVNVALQDYAGKSNTDAIINALGEGNAPAAEFCRNFVFPNGQAGYLPAVGEFNAYLDNYSEVEDILEGLGGDSIDDASYRFLHSSTQADSGSMWYINTYSGDFWKGSKTTSFNSRPFTSVINPTIVSFTIVSAEYGTETFQCIGGTTFNRFCKSAFNTFGASCGGDSETVYISRDDGYYFENIIGSDVIEAGKVYEIKSLAAA